MVFTEKELKWHYRFLNIAFEVASWSKDRSTRAGCVVVKDRRILSTGYNGFPPGIDDDNDYYHQRPQKYTYVQHDSQNAIYQAAKYGIQVPGADMYLTTCPCGVCAGGIVSVGIKRVFWPEQNDLENGHASERWQESVRISLEIMQAANIQVIRVPYKDHL